MITVTINGQELKLEKPVTILDAAEMLGIKIPVFCNYPGLEKYGGCRMCLVEVEKMPRLQTSCTLYVTDNMVVKTESEQIAKARKSTLEFLLIHHPLDCPVCEKAGECELQDNTLRYGAAQGRFFEGKRKHHENLSDPLIARNTERCILCTRCIRMCDGVQGASALTIRARGDHSVMEPFSGNVFDCDYCGNCITVCPVGALLSKPHRHTYRPWQMEKNLKSVCGFCGVGCTMTLQVRSNKLMRTLPELGLGINNGILCSLGRFGYDYVQGSDRLTTPLIRKDGQLEPASWDEALGLVADRLKDIKSRYGGGSIAGLASPRCTNEENYLFQKFFRAGLASNNIDSSARSFGACRRYLENILGKGATANPVSEIKESGAVIVIGGDPVHIAPVLGVQVRDAHINGAKVLTIGYAPGLERFRTHGLSIHPFTEGILLRAMLAELSRTKDASGKNNPLEAKIKEITNAAMPDAEKICGIQHGAIKDAVNDISKTSSVSVVIGPDIAQRTDGSTNLFLVSSIAYLLDARVYLLSERPNEQGVADSGCVPDAFPGGTPLYDEAARKLCEDSWQCNIPLMPGLTLFEMIGAADSGSLKAMYIMGENPVFNLPDRGYIKTALEKLDFLVVQDMFMTETAELADVVLPSMSWAEKDGTYTNLESRIQRLGKGIERQGPDELEIIPELGRRIGLDMPYRPASDVFNEMAGVSPLYAGLSYSDIEKGSGLRPYSGSRSARSFEAELPADIADSWIPPERRGLYLCLERHMFRSETIAGHSKSLNSIYKGPYAKISPETARRHKLAEGESVIIRSEKGQVILPVKIEKGISDYAVVLANYHREKGGLMLVPLRTDPVLKLPCINGTEVSIEKAE